VAGGRGGNCPLSYILPVEKLPVNIILLGKLSPKNAKRFNVKARCSALKRANTLICKKILMN